MDGTCQPCEESYTPNFDNTQCLYVPPTSFNVAPVFISNIEFSEPVNIDSGESSLELPQIVDVNGNFESITIESSGFGTLEYSNDTGEFQSELSEGCLLSYDFEANVIVLTLPVDSL